jgi:subtilase family serine protease
VAPAGLAAPAAAAATTVLATVAAALAAVGLATASAQASALRATIAGTHPSWAVPAREIAAPNVSAAVPVRVRVYLAGRDPAGLAAYATAVATPGNAAYHRYLTAAAAEQRFGPSAAQVNAVMHWLTSTGLRVTTVTQHYVAVSGSASAAEAAFGVRLARFRTPAGAVATAPSGNATVPADVRSAVLTVTGLDTAAILMHPALTQAGATQARATQAGSRRTALPGPPAGFYTAGPCSTYYGQRLAASNPAAYGKHVPWAICGYTPAQLRGAYGLAGSVATGKGVTVAIVDAYASPTMPADANQYSAAVGEPVFGQQQYQQIEPTSYTNISQCGAASWYLEQSLDIEAVHAMAPGANVLYVAAADCTFGPLLDALTKIVDNHLADVVSNSWTGSEQGLTSPITAAFDQVFQQGAVEGIGFDFASGDCGYNNPVTSCGTAEQSGANQVDFPTSSPWVTAVGGTTLAIGQNDSYQWETGWGDQVVPQNGTRWKPAPPGIYPADWPFGGGGGTSTIYPQPSYQAGVVPATLSTRLPNGHVARTPMRELPDVAMDGDPATGFLYGETVLLRNGTDGFQLSRVGGTSLSSPLFAGLEADAAQATGSGTIGFANPLLYGLAGGSAFHDVTDSPLGPGVRIAAVRDEWSNPATGTGKIKTSLYTFGMDGAGLAALRALPGYDDVTGLGSPAAAFLAQLGAAGTSG